MSWRKDSSFVDLNPEPTKPGAVSEQAASQLSWIAYWLKEPSPPAPRVEHCISEGTLRALSTLATWAPSKKTATKDSGRGPAPPKESAGALILDLPASRTETNEFVI